MIDICIKVFHQKNLGLVLNKLKFFLKVPLIGKLTPKTDTEALNGGRVTHVIQFLKMKTKEPIITIAK